MIWLIFGLALGALSGCGAQGAASVNDDAAMRNDRAVVSKGTVGNADFKDVAIQLKNLWNLDQARRIPFDVDVVCAESRNGYRAEGFYLTSEMTSEGLVRLYCTFARPEKTDKPVPLYVNLTGGGADLGFVLNLAESNKCAALDIEWRNPTASHKSRWAHPAIDNKWTVTGSIADNFSHDFVVGICRAIDYITGLPEIDARRIACGGGSMGGWYSLLAAGVDSRITTVFDTYGAGGLGKSHSQIGRQIFRFSKDQQKIWKAAYDPISYAPRTQAATLMYLGSNDFFFWLGDGIRNYDALAGKKRLLILPNYNHGSCGFGDNVPVCGGKWIAHYLRGEPDFPKVTDPVSRGRTYTWKASGPLKVTKAILYWSPGKSQWPARYWMAIPATGDCGKWSASIPEEYSGLSGQVYVTIFDEQDRAVSSRPVARKGVDPQKVPGPLWTGRALWDVAHGPSAWRNPGAVVRNSLYRFQVEAASPMGLKIYPNVKEGRFAMVTNSVILASAQAACYKGVRLVVNGCGHAGKMVVALQRDSGCPFEVDYEREVAYGESATVINIPWSILKRPVGAPLAPFPFDGLRLDGERGGDLPFVIERLELYR